MTSLEQLREQVALWRDRKIAGKTALSRGHIERITREVTDTADGLETRAREMLSKFGVVSPDDSNLEHAMRMIIGNEGLDVFEPIPGLNTSEDETNANGPMAPEGDGATSNDQGQHRVGSGQAGPTPGGQPHGPGENGTPDGTRGRKSRRTARQAGTVS